MPETGRTPFSRLWLIEDRAGPANVPAYQGRGRAMAPSWDFGDRTPVREPDPDRYGAFRIVTAIKGERGLPTLPVEIRHMFTASEFLRIARRGCPLDLQVHMGKCQDPRDFNGGWDKVLTLEGADISNWGTSEMGALEQGQDAVINEAIDLNGLDMYEILPITMAELAADEVMGEVVGIVICDSVQCGECGVPSSGCQHFFAITITDPGSPGLPAELIFSADGGLTIGETNIATLGAGDDPTGLACVGIYLVVLSNDGDNYHYAPLADILNGVEVWTEVATLSDGTAWPAAGSPNAIFSLGSAHNWIVGDLGYIFFAEDITAGPVVQDPGIAAGGNNLNDVHAYDEDNVLVVGAAGACAVTRDGGANWANVDTTDITGPVELTCCWMRTADEWFVGTILGALWYTRDGGVNWTEKAFPGSGAGVCRDIVFATPTVGYLAHSAAGPAGRILRTIDGGYSWYVLPESTGAMPANDYVTSLASVAECPNVVYGGGLGDTPPDGFLVKGA